MSNLLKPNSVGRFEVAGGRVHGSVELLEKRAKREKETSGVVTLARKGEEVLSGENVLAHELLDQHLNI